MQRRIGLIVWDGKIPNQPTTINSDVDVVFTQVTCPTQGYKYRKEFGFLLYLARENDTVVSNSINEFALTLHELIKNLRIFKKRGINVEFIKEKITLNLFNIDEKTNIRLRYWEEIMEFYKMSKKHRGRKTKIGGYYLKKVGDAELLKIQRDIDIGMTYTNIAKRYGISVAPIYYNIAKNKLIGRKRRNVADKQH